jgi:hypothetical protein
MEYKLYQVKSEKFSLYNTNLIFYNKQNLYFEDYNLIYTGKIKKDNIYIILDRLFENFNINHPENFNGRSMSISDIIYINKKYYIVMPNGFKEANFNTRD